MQVESWHQQRQGLKRSNSTFLTVRESGQVDGITVSYCVEKSCFASHTREQLNDELLS
jgi:hypothetical protein